MGVNNNKNYGVMYNFCLSSIQYKFDYKTFDAMVLPLNSGQFPKSMIHNLKKISKNC